MQVASEHAWPGIGAHGSLVLPLGEDAWAWLAPALALDGHRFERKREFHLTLIGRAGIAQVALRCPGPVEDTLREAFDGCDWTCRTTGRFLLLCDRATEPAARSVIERVQVPGLAVFHQRLSRRGCTLPLPPAHVTLYTHVQPLGIGVASDAELARLQVRPLHRDEIINGGRQCRD